MFARRFLLLALLAASAWATELPPGFVEETLATELDAVTALAVSPDGRVFVAEQTGALRVWKDGAMLAEPAINLAERLDAYWERGLIGLALAPDFPRSPHVYLLYAWPRSPSPITC